MAQLSRTSDRSQVRFGTSSFSSRDWVGPFYPLGTKPADYLKTYAQHFDTVEVDSTYYAIPSRSTVEGWVEKVPGNFIISAKFPRDIVHGGTDARPDADIILDPRLTYDQRDRFLETISNLGGNLGPLILQFPYFSRKIFPDKSIFFESLDRFLQDLPEDFQYGVEIRNKQWLCEDFAAICRENRVAVVLSDYMWMPLGDEVERIFDPLTAEFSYVRLIGNRKEIEKVTTTWEREVIDREDRLDRWAAFLQRIAQRGGNVFVYVNNHYAGHAPATLRRLEKKYHDLSTSSNS